MKTVHSSEKGQIVILLVLVLLGLLGFTALAIDGGMIYADQRYSQSVADATSLAGGSAAGSKVNRIESWSCGGVSASMAAAYPAAYEKARLNGFDIETDPSLGSVNVTCSDTGQYIDVEVTISKVTQTSFIHLFNNGEMRTTVYSKTRVVPRLPASNGQSIVSLSKECKPQHDGSWFYGNSNTTLHGGGVYSNSCVDAGGSTIVNIIGGGVTYHSGSYSAGIDDPTPVADENYHPLTNNPIPDPVDNCIGMQNWGSAIFPASDPPHTLQPGYYSDWDFKVPVTLEPGIYCVTGNVTMSSTGYVTGTGVTIRYDQADANDGLTINGGVDSVLSAPTGEPIVGNAVANLLLYIPPETDAKVKINGNSSSVFSGTMYMPDSYVEINGTTDMSTPFTLSSSIIGYWVNILGDAWLDIYYDDSLEWKFPAFMQLHE